MCVFLCEMGRANGFKLSEFIRFGNPNFQLILNLINEKIYSVAKNEKPKKCESKFKKTINRYQEKRQFSNVNT